MGFIYFLFHSNSDVLPKQIKVFNFLIFFFFGDQSNDEVKSGTHRKQNVLTPI